MLVPERNRIVWCCPGLAGEAQLIDQVRNAGWSIARQCVDAADVLGAVSVEPTSLVVASSGIRRVDPALWSEVCDTAAAVFVIREPGDHLPAHPGTGHIELSMERASEFLARDVASHTPSVGGGARAGGRVVSIWGTPGAPGRTTIAMGLADAWARSGLRVCLIDADTYGPSIAQSLAMVEPASGLLLACKHVDQGSLDEHALARALRSIRPGLDVLTGLDDAARWPEVRSDALLRVVARCRDHFDVTILDTHDCIEDTVDPISGLRGERNGITQAAMKVADHLLVVARADPVGVPRLVRALADVSKIDSRTSPTIVLNRLQRRFDASEVRNVLARIGTVQRVEHVPEDRAVAKAVARGSLLGEMRCRSAARSRLRGLARDLVAA